MTETAAAGSWWAHVEQQAARSLAALELAGPALLEALTDGQRYETRGAVHVMWNPHAIGTTCRTAPGRTVTATAAPVDCARCAAGVLAEHAERLAELEPAAELEAAPAVLVVVPCGKTKRAETSPAGELYTGSSHRRAREAADALAARVPSGARVVILSAAHGLLDLAEPVAPYDVTLPNWRALAGPPAVAQLVARQLAETGARTVVALTSSRYTEVLRYAAGRTGAQLVAPLAGIGSQGEGLARLVNIRDGGDLADAIADALAGPLELEAATPAAPVVEHLADEPAQLALFAA